MTITGGPAFPSGTDFYGGSNKEYGRCVLGHCPTPSGCEDSGRCRADCTAPPQRKPLSDEEISKVAAPFYGVLGFRVEAFARALEAAHGIKEKT
jgi:hypothetical protein